MAPNDDIVSAIGVRRNLPDSRHLKPTTDEARAASVTNARCDGFAMGFTAHVHRMNVEPGKGH